MTIFPRPAFTLCRNVWLPTCTITSYVSRCGRYSLKCSSISTVVKSGDTRQLIVVSANAHRRHLTPDRKRELVAALLKARPERSDRTTARVAKVSPTTVGRIRTALEEAGELNVKLSNRLSVRKDVPPAPGAPTLDQVKLVNYDRAWATDNKDRLIKKWQSAVGL